MVEVANGAVDLYVEHRGACQASELPTDLMLGELRQLGATKVTTSHRRTDLCHTIYQICGKHLTSASTVMRSKTDTVGRATPLCFTLAGERGEDVSLPIPSTTECAYSLKAVVRAETLNKGVEQLPSCGNCMVAVLSESTLDHCMVSAGMMAVDSGGFPLHYFPPEWLRSVALMWRCVMIGQ